MGRQRELAVLAAQHENLGSNLSLHSQHLQKKNVAMAPMPSFNVSTVEGGVKRSLGLAGHQLNSRFSERPCLKQVENDKA